jgi:phosphatidate cytidylyltransferase
VTETTDTPLVPATPARSYGRAGRNLPQAIGLGVGLGAYVVLSLLYFQPAFVVLVAVALAMASVELYSALRKQEMTAAIVPIVGGCVAIPIGSYLAGQETTSLEFSTTSVLLASLALTVFATLVWRMPKGAKGYVKDAAASLLIVGYVPLLGSFAALMLAEDQGAARLVTFMLVVTMSDTGGLVAGVLFGKHPMAPMISPKKSWEGFAGSTLFTVAAGWALVVYLLDGDWWVGVCLGLIAVVMATLGDLCESVMKRDLGIKDMSQVIPGHGGLMDRLDSLLATIAPIWLLLHYLVF